MPIKSIFTALCVLYSLLSFAQSEPLKVFIDCNCDRTYLMKELAYVNLVRDQDLSDIEIYVNSIGNVYELNYIGRNQFLEKDNTLSFTRLPVMTSDDIRKLLKRKIEQGLLTYLVETDLANRITFFIPNDTMTVTQKVDEEDPWDRWIFELKAAGNGDRQSNRSSFRYNVGFETDRVTEEWRFRGDTGFDRAEISFKDDSQTFLSIRQSYYGRGSLVKSINSHWSAGVFTGVSHNTYSNFELSYYFQPAIEYNIFQYSEVIRREITFAYQIGYLNNKYIEETIFGFTEEQLFRHSLNMTIRFRQPWGDISSNFLMRSLLDDISVNRVSLDSYINIRLFKGLSLRLSTNLKLIRDQINLPNTGASIEDILLQQRQIATNFQVRGSVGLSYTFGSAFNNILNTRL
jgi:hypothetical protein